jgi:hypothetical protein
MSRLPIVISFALAVTTALAACGPDPVGEVEHGFAIEIIDRDVHFDTPLPASLYVDYRAISYPGRTIEYGVAVDGIPLVIVYTIAPAAALPLQTRIFDGDTLAPLLALDADDRTLEITTAGATAPLRVDDYTDPAAAQITGTAGVLPAHLRPLLDIVLPARNQIAPVPAFWQNVDQPDGVGGDIGETSTAGRPLLPAWSAPVSLLGALFLQSPCVAGTTGYACPCLHIDDPAVGTVETCAP